MKKWIRGRGLTAFVVVTAIILAFFWFFADGLVKRAVEKTGTVLVGAKVELDDADLSLSPLGLRLSHLQVTNPDAPMTNAVEISRIAFSMDALNLLRRKVIIEEMAVDGVRLNTPRKNSGALPHPPKGVRTLPEKSVIESLPLPSLEIPDVHEILEKEDLESLKLARSVRGEIETERGKWPQKLGELPDKAKLEEYKDRLKKLTSGQKGGLKGILGGASDLIALRKDLKRDLDRINTARTELKNNIATLQKRMDEANRAPLDDVRRLKEKYSLSSKGLSNISRMLLGGEIGDWTETALHWYEKLKPALSRGAEPRKDVTVTKPIRGKGVDVRFKEKNPLPDFLIHTARVSVEIPAGVLAGRVQNVTPDQDVLGVPLTFRFSGETMKDLQALTLEGALNHVDPTQSKDQAVLEVRGYPIQNLILSKSKDFPIALNKGLTDLDARAVWVNDSLDAQISAGLKSVQITSGLSENAKPLAKVMASALSEIKSFNLKADISGTVKNYDLRMTSDLDRVLQEAVGKQIKEQQAQFEAKLRAAVSGKVDKELADLKSGLGGLNGIADELTARLKIGEGLLK